MILNLSNKKMCSPIERNIMNSVNRRHVIYSNGKPDEQVYGSTVYDISLLVKNDTANQGRGSQMPRVKASVEAWGSLSFPARVTLRYVVHSNVRPACHCQRKLLLLYARSLAIWQWPYGARLKPNSRKSHGTSNRQLTTKTHWHAKETNACFRLTIVTRCSLSVILTRRSLTTN